MADEGDSIRYAFGRIHHLPAFDPDVSGGEPMQAQLRRQKINRFKSSLEEASAAFARVIAASEELCRT